MFLNYFLVAFRNLLKQRAYTFINITGMAIGITCSIFIILFVNHELSYDRFHDKADRIFRVGVSGKFSGNEFNQAITAQPMAQALISDYPEVQNVVPKYWPPYGHLPFVFRGIMSFIFIVMFIPFILITFFCLCFQED